MNGSINNAPILCALIVFAAPALAQQPTDAQLSAIRSACRADYKSVCADVPTGASQLTPLCQSALLAAQKK